jgi:hypothetical protein
MTREQAPPRTNQPPRPTTTTTMWSPTFFATTGVTPWETQFLTANQARAALGIALPGPLDALVAACHTLRAACREYTEAWQ